jgi:hypothetical protein
MYTTYLAKPPLSRRRPFREPVTPEGAEVLATVRRTQDAVRSGEVEILKQVVEWARLHEVEEGSYETATWGESPLPLGGEGAPLVSEYCLAEFAAAVGMKTESGRYFIAHALELAHRLPYLYARILAGAVPVWRARRIAEKTLVLSAEAAAYVDVEIAPAADKIGPVVTERLVDEAISRFMPDYARELAEKAAEQRHVTVDRRQIGFHGTSRVYGELDLADALDLEDALARGAEFLKDQGSNEPLDVRRSQALGRLARGELDGSDVTVYVHVEATSTTGELEPHATVENGGLSLVSIEQVKTWCRTGNVSIRSVIDLNKTLTSAGYQPSDTLREQVILRDKTCVFAHCTKTARTADLDHIEPYDPDGRPGQTATDKLAGLCRPHHRLKTHGGWSYQMIAPGTYLWHSPYGYQYLRGPDGSTEQLASATSSSSGSSGRGSPQPRCRASLRASP